MLTGNENSSKCGRANGDVSVRLLFASPRSSAAVLRALRDLRFCVCRLRREACDLDVYVLLAPEGNSRQPVLLFDQSLSARPIVGRKYARRGRELRPRDFAAHGARRDSHLRTIPDAFVLPRIAPRLYIKLVILLSKPNRRSDGDTALAEGGQTDIFLALNFAGDGHRNIVRDKNRSMSLVAENVQCSGPSSGNEAESLRS